MVYVKGKGSRDFFPIIFFCSVSVLNKSLEYKNGRTNLFLEEEERRIIRREKIGKHEREVIAGG